ncbi:MAG: hypothetical protein EGR29_01935 [Faecalibacterium prausnitzii]|nr:hypothetical protein [Faecalibacterium prausnitzii]
MHNLSVTGSAVTAPLVGEPLAKDSIFAIFADAPKTASTIRQNANGSRAKSSEALRHENATICQGLPY